MEVSTTHSTATVEATVAEEVVDMGTTLDMVLLVEEEASWLTDKMTTP